MPAILIAYYSRTGTTKQVAELLQTRLGADSEEISSVKKRSGVIGYFICGKEATKKELAEIYPTDKVVKDYDLVILGTPVWGWNISSPIRSYLTQHIGQFKKLACFCTMGGSGDLKSFLEVEKICGIKLLAQAGFLTRDVRGKSSFQGLDQFIKAIQNSLSV